MRWQSRQWRWFCNPIFKIQFVTISFSKIHEIGAFLINHTVVLGTWNKRRKIGEILRENKRGADKGLRWGAKKKILLRTERVHRNDGGRSREIGGRGDVKEDEEKMRWRAERGKERERATERRVDRNRNAHCEQDGDGDEKSILSLEMPTTNCPARDKILAVVRNSARKSPTRTWILRRTQGRRTRVPMQRRGISRFQFLFFGVAEKATKST